MQELANSFKVIQSMSAFLSHSPQVSSWFGEVLHLLDVSPWMVPAAISIPAVPLKLPPVSLTCHGEICNVGKLPISVLWVLMNNYVLIGMND